MLGNFSYCNPTKLHFGPEALDALAGELAHYGKRVQLIYGGGSIKKNGIYDQVVSILKAAGKEIFEDPGVMPNPTTEKLYEGCKIARENNVDLLLAVGGGSCCDYAKGVSVSAWCDEDPWEKYYVRMEEPANRLIPVGCVLTMVGTGSEMNGGSVITNHATKQKIGHVFGEEVFPKFSILNPKYTYTLPKYQMVAGIYDIMNHITEQYFSGEDDCTSDYLMEGLMRSLLHSSRIAVKDPENYEARSNLMWIATWALNTLVAQGKDTDWMVHMIGQSVGAYTDATHGMTLSAVSLPYYRYVMPYGLHQFKKFAVNVWGVRPEGKTDEAIAQEGLAAMEDWVNVPCPCCGAPAKRETDTMPQWAGSSWYFLRYMDPHNDKALASKEALEYWSPVDWYNGGMEHTTLHLLYSRFWHKFLYDIGVVPTKEPYAKRTSHGMILGEGGEKMSKSRGNVVNPNDIVAQYGADTMRLHIMFIGDFEKAVTWSNEAVKGSKRFLDRCWNLMDLAQDSDEISEKNEALIHKTIKKVTADIDDLKMNTAIAALMAMVNEFYTNGLTRGDLEQLMLLLSPFAPHMVEEMWELTGYAGKTGKMAMQMPWPAYDEGKTVDTHVDMAIQVNGKLKGAVTVPAGSGQETVMAAAMELDKVRKATEGMTVVKTILVKDKLMNLIVKPAK